LVSSLKFRRWPNVTWLECNNTAAQTKTSSRLVLKWLLLAQRMALAAYKHIWRVMLSVEP